MYCTLHQAAIRPLLKLNIIFDGGLLWQGDTPKPADAQVYLSAVSCLALYEEFFSKTNIEVKFMSLWKSNNIDIVWSNICKHEGDVFCTVKNRKFTYVVKDNCIVLSIPSQTRITKAYFEKALKMNASRPTEINLRGQSYIYAIITDDRIK